MGIVRMGINHEFCLDIKNKLGLDCFIETGTFYGGTSKWAAEHFQVVHTIENSEEIYADTKDDLKKVSNLNHHFGHSKEVLKQIDFSKNKTLFWLDAHWCGENSYGEDDQCPLIEELEIIIEKNPTSLIIIDDARLFTCPPPKPNKIEEYPSLTDIVKAVENTHETFVHDDNFYLIPNQHGTWFKTYIQEKLTLALEDSYKLKENKWLQFKIKVREILNLLSK